MGGFDYWNFICKLKNYYYGNTNSGEKIKKEVNGRIEWFNNYFNLFQNPMYLQDINEPLPNLKRGNIILVELGFNIGMEFGGQHYCIVLKDSSITNNRVLVLPITSQKPKDYELHKNTYYIEFKQINGLNRKKDKTTGYGHKRWVSITNIRAVSKSRIIYPIERGIPNMTNGQMREISNRIISQIAMRKDLISLPKAYNKLQNKYLELQKEYESLKNDYENMQKILEQNVSE